MSSAHEAYEKARKMGLACYKKQVIENKNPYLPVLDSILTGSKIKKESRIGVHEILLDHVVGTKTEGRTNAFAANFMPLLEKESEFADKWISLYASQMQEGIREPVKVYELFGRYFVQEGNKRVSVMKYCRSPMILAEVHRIIVDPKDSPEAQIYNEYIQFCEKTGVYSILVSQPKSYLRLLKLVKPDKDSVFSPLQSKNLEDDFLSFRTVLKKIYKDRSNLKAGDAYLLYLDAFGYHPDQIKGHSELEKELAKLLPDFEMYPEKRQAKLSTDTQSSEKQTLISSILPKPPLKVAFINTKDESTSEWTADHAHARRKLEEALKGQISVSVFDHADSQEDVKNAMDKAIAEDNEVIFATSPLMLQTANQYAAKYPKIKILNCSLNLDTGYLRTYYAREFEVQFLMGILAGILTRTNHIGYVASYPIYGAVANINAFAIGVQMTNPKARIYLDWSTTSQSNLNEEPLDIDILFIDQEKFSQDILITKKMGLFDVGRGKFFNLAKVANHWEVFYKKIVLSVLNNTWKTDTVKLDSESINYWWGLSNGLLELEFSGDLPLQTKRLVSLLRDNMAQMQFMPFDGTLLDQQGQIHSPMSWEDLDDIARMDWLNSNIIGSVPEEKLIAGDATSIVQIHGLDKLKESES